MPSKLSNGSTPTLLFLLFCILKKGNVGNKSGAINRAVLSPNNSPNPEFGGYIHRLDECACC